MLAAISYPPVPLFDVGPLTLSLHGLFAALGFAAGAWIASRELAKRGFDTLKYQSVLTWGLVGALVGARYLTTPAAILDGVPLATALRPLGGSFSILGGFAGGIVGGVWQMRRLGLPVWPILDGSTVGLALGTLVGRVGDLFIVEHLGRATTVPWGYGVKPGYDLAPAHNALECTEATAGLDGLCGVYHHVAAYDLIGAALLIGVLYLLRSRYRMRYGQFFSVWAIWYGLQRFLLDFLRFGMGDRTIGSFTWNQVSGLAIAVGGAVLFWYMGRSQPQVSRDEDQRLGATFDVDEAGVET